MEKMIRLSDYRLEDSKIKITGSRKTQASGLTKRLQIIMFNN